IVYYYGGTSPSQRRGDIYYGGHIFASRGYIVYILNPSGTTGYGQEISARHVNAWGIRTADEIIEGTKLVCDKYSFIDKTKVGCIGASYGGFMTQYLQTKTDIFAAAVSHAGISDVTSYWGEGFWGVGYSKLAASGSYPWNNPKLYTEQGSLFNADKINTPLLLLHGSEDTNVPIGESIQIYNALKVLGKEVEFIVVNGENHTIIKDLNRQQKWHNSIMAWFAKWLQESPEWWSELYPKVYTE
ncbi:MAG: prolyl oligopeptidase family serine peptidase, partial [bacterium]